MRKFRLLCLNPVVLLTLCLACTTSRAQEKQALRLVQTIPMPNVKGRIDHMDVDVEGKRLFVAAVENGSMEVVDLDTGRWRRTIAGFKAPTGMCDVRELNELFVAGRDDGLPGIFRASCLHL